MSTLDDVVHHFDGQPGDRKQMFSVYAHSNLVYSDLGQKGSEEEWIRIAVSS